MERKQNMKYVRLFFILCVICMRGYAQPSYTIQHVENALVISTYEFDGLSFVHKRHTIRIGEKEIPFTILAESNVSILRDVFCLDTAECNKYWDLDFVIHLKEGVYRYDLHISDFEYGYDRNRITSNSFYYKKNDRKHIYAVYKLTGDIVVYSMNGIEKEEVYPKLKDSLKSLFSLKNFAILKSADSLSSLSVEEQKKNHFVRNGVYTIYFYAPE